jgi:hypothetical protein
MGGLLLGGRIKGLYTGERQAKRAAQDNFSLPGDGALFINRLHGKALRHFGVDLDFYLHKNTPCCSISYREYLKKKATIKRQ